MPPWLESLARSAGPLTHSVREALAGRLEPLLKGRRVTASLQSGSIRLVVGTPEEIELWAEEPLPAGSLHGPQGLDQQAVARAIRALRSRTRVPSQGWAIAIQAPRAVARVLDLPPIPRRHLGTVVLREARKEFPISLNELYFYWTPIPAAGDGNRVFTLGVPRDAIDSHLAAFEVAGVGVGRLNLHPLALAGAGAEPDSLHVNLDGQTMTLVIVREGVPFVVRVLDLDNTPPAGPRDDAVLQELVRTVRFHNQSGGRLALPASTTVEVSGSLASSPELVRLREGIRQNLGYEARSFAPARAVPQGFPAHLYAPNLGLLAKRS